MSKLNKKMNLIDWIEKEFGSKVANFVATSFVIAFIAFFVWLLFIPNGICDGACIGEIDFFEGSGGSPFDPAADY